METLTQYQATSTSNSPATAGLTDRVDLYRLDAARDLDPEQRSAMGQFFTPPAVARFMASLFGDSPEIRLLDAGAGVGTLTAAFVEELCQRPARPRTISAIAYEMEPLLAEYLHSTMVECREAAHECGVEFAARVMEEDFIEADVEGEQGVCVDPIDLKNGGQTASGTKPPRSKLGGILAD
jgi:adenine-specific DNA-methyltransferase